MARVFPQLNLFGAPEPNFSTSTPRGLMGQTGDLQTFYGAECCCVGFSSGAGARCWGLRGIWGMWSGVSMRGRGRNRGWAELQREGRDAKGDGRRLHEFVPFSISP